MSYWGTLEAVRARLAGNSPFYVPPFPAFEPLTKDAHMRPARVGTLRFQAAKVSDPFNSSVTGRTSTDTSLAGRIEVPIFEFNEEGRSWEQTWPCFTYEVIGFKPRYADSTYGEGAAGDNYIIPVEPSLTEVEEDGISYGLASTLFVRRPVEHPYDIMVEIRARSQQRDQMLVLVQHIVTAFAPRGFLKVPMRDGTDRSWDMLFLDQKDRDLSQATAEGATPQHRGYESVWTFNVEGYLDNTDQGELLQRIRSRTLSMAKMEE